MGKTNKKNGKSKAVKSVRVENVARPMKQNVFKFKKIDQQGAIISSGAVPPLPGETANGWSFSLDRVPGYTHFMNMFDQFQIIGIRVELRPQFNKATVLDTNYGVLYTIVDYDDIIPPTLTSAQTHRTSRQHTLTSDKPIIRYFKPKTLGMVYRGPATTGYVVNKPQWVDTTYSDVPHYGFKVYWAGFSDNLLEINLSFVYYLKFRNPH